MPGAPSSVLVPSQSQRAIKGVVLFVAQGHEDSLVSLPSSATLATEQQEVSTAMGNVAMPSSSPRNNTSMFAKYVDLA